MSESSAGEEKSVATTCDGFYDELKAGNKAADRKYKIRFLWVYFWKILFGDGATVLFYLALPVIPLTGELATASGRLVYALSWHIFPAFLFIAGSYAVIWIRGLKANWSAWNPYRSIRDGNEIDLVNVNNRVLQNHVEGYIPFLVVSLITATYLDETSMLGVQLIPCIVVTWTVGRVLYWVGYLTRPWYRLAGVMLSFHLTIYLAVYCVYRFFMG